MRCKQGQFIKGNVLPWTGWILSLKVVSMFCSNSFFKATTILQRVARCSSSRGAPMFACAFFLILENMKVWPLKLAAAVRDKCLASQQEFAWANSCQERVIKVFVTRTSKAINLHNHNQFFSLKMLCIDSRAAAHWPSRKRFGNEDQVHSGESSLRKGFRYSLSFVLSSRVDVFVTRHRVSLRRTPVWPSTHWPARKVITWHISLARKANLWTTAACSC